MTPQLARRVAPDPELGYVLDLDRWIALRRAAGLSPTALGTQIGRSHFSIRVYEQGKTDPPSAVVCSVARVFGVHPSELFRPARPEDMVMSEVRVIAPRPRRRRQARAAS
jgi:hypothetical protein